MEIIVCIKQVPGTTQVDIDEETGVLKRDGVASKMNPYDLYAIETAVQLRENHGGSIHALSMGPPQAESIIREAYMMGADKGTLLSDRRFAGADVLATAYALSQGIKKIGKSDLIICGKMTTDGDTAQVGPEIAEFLDIPHVTNVLRILEIKDDSIILEMDMPTSVEVVEVSFPCLITVEKGIYEPRLPSYKLKLKTRDFPVTYMGLDDLEDKDVRNYGLNGSPTQVKRIFEPTNNEAHEIWRGDRDILSLRVFEQLKKQKFL